MTRRRKHYRLDMPADLSDETAAEILDFLYEMVRVFESRYFTQLRRRHDASRADSVELGDAPTQPAADPANPDTDPSL